ncbi:MAG: ABC transporter ATP-binding protein [Pseudomonadales bacterium]
MLEIRALSKSFHQADGDVRVLADLALQLDAGETAALLGESGSGKSTLLNIIAGLERADTGQLTVAGQVTRGFSSAQWNELRRTELGLVFQQYHLVPTLSVADNLALQARLANQYDADMFHSLTEKLGLQSLLQRLPHQLSGGQQQRVAIGRALMHRPKLVLADEPTGNLDEQTSAEVMALFTEMVKATNCTLLMVTHSPTMANFLDRRLRLHQGQISPIAAT